MSKRKSDKARVTGSHRKGEGVTTAIHAQSEDGAEHLVGIGNLRVMLFNEENSWFAQGLEIDYFAQGETLEDVQDRFQDGLQATVDLHLRMHGHISGVLQAAPQEVWTEFYSAKPRTVRHTQVSFHLPFAGIQYYGQAESA